MLNKLQKQQILLDKILYQQAGVDWKWSSLYNAKRLKLNILVEIGELANELRTFKVWRKKTAIDLVKVKEELIDCLCFFLGLTSVCQINFDGYQLAIANSEQEFNELLLELFSATEKLHLIKKEEFYSSTNSKNVYFTSKELVTYDNWLQVFSKLVAKLEMEEAELLEVYLRKNEINQQRIKKGGH